MADIDDLKLKLAAAEARAVAAEARAVAAEARAVAAEAGVAALENQVAELLEQLNRNSKNSNKPPSTESPAERLQRRAREQAREQQRKKDEAKKKRGGQPGHDGAQRALVPADQVDDVVDHRPVECAHCWSPLPTIDNEHAQRSQTWELPPIRPEVIEHRFHAVTCLCCAHTTAAAFVPPPVFGPRGHGIVATLTGSYHLSRRKTAALLSDLMGLTISLGAVSDIEARVSLSARRTSPKKIGETPSTTQHRCTRPWIDSPSTATSSISTANRTASESRRRRTTSGETESPLQGCNRRRIAGSQGRVRRLARLADGDVGGPGSF